MSFDGFRLAEENIGYLKRALMNGWTVRGKIDSLNMFTLPCYTFGTGQNVQEVAALDVIDLIRIEKESISIPEMRKMLGIGKTESYWLLQNKGLQTFVLKGCKRIRKKDFWDWYSRQTRHRLLDGPPPGSALQETSYSVRELTELLAVSRDTIYALLKKNVFDTFQADNHTRVTKDSFERWYARQSRFKRAEDREKEADALRTSYSMPELAQLLGIHRNTVYEILKKRKDIFDMIEVAGQKRVTVSSFEVWYRAQSHYKKVQKARANNLVEEIPQPPALEEEAVISTVMPKCVYRVVDLQKALSISQKAVYRRIQAGEICAVKAGKEYLISPAEFHRMTGGGTDSGNDYSKK